eukprot:1159810-Pelagomonas_calceolata.AAC.11
MLVMTVKLNGKGNKKGKAYQRGFVCLASWLLYRIPYPNGFLCRSDRRGYFSSVAKTNQVYEKT